jgi:hydrogenase maturation protein HypF
MSITGVVQGVGFRPFVYNLARSLNLKGWVNNTARGVELEVEGREGILTDFARRVRVEAPPLAIIEEYAAAWQEPVNYEDFVIAESKTGQDKSTIVAPDIATCPQCLDELNDPANRRYRYPFTNCTNCGPRFTIIKDVPYDRPCTTMAEFSMCPDCREEYENPRDRRFHAQPNACPVCGPRVILLDRRGCPVPALDQAARTVELLKEGYTVAVKGLGGYHLVCDALNSSAVNLLRARKNREVKPFGVMFRDLAAVRKHCRVSKAEEEVLSSGRRPIVLLRKRLSSKVFEEVAPCNRYLGVMLPYTPLHHLLFVNGPEALVMTSGNSNGEAIEYLDHEALKNLKAFADYFLTHNRDIHLRADDSVVRVFRGQERMIRRSRGYVPLLLKLPFKAHGILALGGELKNTLCLTKEDKAYLSQYIGDLGNISNILAFEQALRHLQKIFDITPAVVACDLHPGYHSSKYALEMTGLVKSPVQHHHAHIASCMAENGLLEDAIGVAFDGTGYGTDGAVWGGEFFTGGYRGFSRWAHLAYVPLPGGATAIKQPWRMAVSYLDTLLGRDSVELALSAFKTVAPEKLAAVQKLVSHWPEKMLTSSAGRLFDAVAALLGVRQEISYEGQAAIELEQLALDDGDCRSYGFAIKKDAVPWSIHLNAMFEEILEDMSHKRSVQTIASRFHRTVSCLIVATCCQIRNEAGFNAVVLSGGVFQNLLLLARTVCLLEKEGFAVYTHSRVPANDGGISLGQAVLAGMAMMERGRN